MGRKRFDAVRTTHATFLISQREIKKQQKLNNHQTENGMTQVQGRIIQKNGKTMRTQAQGRTNGAQRKSITNGKTVAQHGAVQKRYGPHQPGATEASQLDRNHPEIQQSSTHSFNAEVKQKDPIKDHLAKPRTPALCPRRWGPGAREAPKEDDNDGCTNSAVNTGAEDIQNNNSTSLSDQGSADPVCTSELDIAQHTQRISSRHTSIPCISICTISFTSIQEYIHQESITARTYQAPCCDETARPPGFEDSTQSNINEELSDISCISIPCDDVVEPSVTTLEGRVCQNVSLVTAASL